jgi:hypothetical protein
VCELTAAKYRNAGWSEAELDLIRANLSLSPIELAKLFPNRTLAACSQARFRLDGRKPPKPVEYAVHEPGDHVEHLADLLVDDWECLAIWLKWNGYASSREASRSLNGWVTLICTAK